MSNQQCMLEILIKRENIKVEMYVASLYFYCAFVCVAFLIKLLSTTILKSRYILIEFYLNNLI